ncbi:MAG: aldo/keto reductase [Armatimonadota bacterium]
MEMRTCGKSDIEISAIGVGCWSFGGGEDDYWGKQEQEKANEVVKTALDMGISHFDTAEAYNNGRSEEALGKALQGIRDEVVVASKIAPSNCEQGVITEHCEASLDRLDTDYLDIYYVHWPITEYPVDEAFEELTELKQAGKIRSICVSNFGPTQLSEALDTGAQIDLNQLNYSLLSRAIEVEIVPMCMENNIGVVGYMPLMQGILAGKYHDIEEIPPVRRRTRHFSTDNPLTRHGEPGAEKEVFRVVDELREISDEMSVPMAELAIAWCIHKPGLTCSLVGARDAEQVKMNARAAEVEMSDEIMQRLDDLTEPLLNRLGSNADYWQSGENSRIR